MSAVHQAQPPRAPGLDLPPRWTDLDDVPILFANHFLVQQHPHEFVISVGQLMEPPLVGSPEQVREQAAALTHVPVTTLARVGVTRDRLRELIAVLQASLDEHDRILGG
jgi:hypothetical protein